MYKMDTNKDVGLFLACYDVVPPKELLGAPSLNLNLMVNAASRMVSGQCTISRALPSYIPPFHVQGEFSIMTVMPQNTHTQVVLNGFPMPSRGNFSFQIVMVLDEFWGPKGTANFSYTDPVTGRKEHFDAFLVKKTECK